MRGRIENRSRTCPLAYTISVTGVILFVIGWEWCECRLAVVVWTWVFGKDNGGSFSIEFINESGSKVDQK